MDPNDFRRIPQLLFHNLFVGCEYDINRITSPSNHFIMFHLIDESASSAQFRPIERKLQPKCQPPAWRFVTFSRDRMKLKMSPHHTWHKWTLKSRRFVMETKPFYRPLYFFFEYIPKSCANHTENVLSVALTNFFLRETKVTMEKDLIKIRKSCTHILWVKQKGGCVNFCEMNLK